MTMSQPCCASPSARDRPIPRLAPVMMATLPFREDIMISVRSAGRRPQDISVIIVERKLRTPEVGKQFLHDRRKVGGVHGDAEQLLQGNSVSHIHLILA